MNSLRSLISVGEKIRISSFASLRGRDVASLVEALRSNIAIVSPHSPARPLKKLPDFACRIGDWKEQIFCFQNTQLPNYIFNNLRSNNFNYVLEHTWVQSNT
jgi:hypothetical protein